MNKDLLFKVSTENLNQMHKALCKIIADMQDAEPDWKSHTNLTHPGKVF